MNIYGSLMDIFDEKTTPAYFTRQLNPKRGYLWTFKKIIHEHLWLIDEHFWRKKTNAPAQPRKRSFMKNQNKIYGSLMDIFDYPKREAQIKQAIKMHVLSEKG